MIPTMLAALTLATTPLKPGTYALVVDSASTSHMAVTGTTSSLTRSLSRVELTLEDGTLYATQEVCDVRVTSDAKATTEIPRAFVAALETQRYALDLSRSEGGTWAFRADPGPTHLGYDPARSGGKVPAKAGDPGVVDADGDGHPGVTVRVKIPVIGTVRMYIVQHAHSRYEGTVRDGRATGRVVQLALEQKTLGASFSPVAATPTIETDPENSRFRLDPVEGTPSCAAMRDAWLGDFAPPSP